MKHVLMFLFLGGIINCDKLDNTYLPPHNAQSSAGANVIQPPAVADLRTKSTLISGQYAAPNIPFGQYPSPDGQNFSPTRQYLPSNSQNSGARYQNSSPSLPANHYIPSNVASGKYPSTNGQPSYANSQQSSANVLPSVSSSQYFPSSVPSAQYSGKNNLFSSPTAQVGIPSSGNFVPTFAKQEPAYQHQGSVNPTAILRSTINHAAGDGSYQYSYETENGISAEEEGSLVKDAETVKGGYSYTSPEGENVVVEYVADGNGFRAKGSHIPEIPEAIQKSIELNKAAAARDGNQGLSDAPNTPYTQYGAPSQAEYQYQGLNGAPKAVDNQYRASSQVGYRNQGLNDASKAPNSHYGGLQRIPSQFDLGLNGGSSYHTQGSSSNSAPSFDGFSQGGYKY